MLSKEKKKKKEGERKKKSLSLCSCKTQNHRAGEGGWEGGFGLSCSFWKGPRRTVIVRPP